jgi:hypothetical protein
MQLHVLECVWLWPARAVSQPYVVNFDMYDCSDFR